MPLTVLSVAFPFAPVGPDAVGGAEQVLTAIDEGLVARGHRSLVVAAAGSQTKGELVATPAFAPPGDDERAWARAAREVRRTIEAVLARERVDLIHLHAYGFERLLPAAGPPVLVTLHMPLDWYPPGALRPDRPGIAFNCVSRSQRRVMPALSEVPVIPNGIAVERFLYRRRKHGFALALGRICPEKGFHLAMDAADRAGLPLLLGGQVFGYAAHERYFREHVVPRLRGRARFLGPASFPRKRRLLAGARCLLLPSLAPETSSLVAMESLASGTPVVAFRAGALPEIVESGRTGFLVDSVDEMVHAIREVGALSPEDCRRRAEERFSIAETIEAYLALYRTLR